MGRAFSENPEAGGGEQREACGLRLAGVVEGVAERELQLGFGGGVLEGDLLLRAAEGEGLLVLTGAGEGVHAGERGWIGSAARLSTMTSATLSTSASVNIAALGADGQGHARPPCSNAKIRAPPASNSSAAPA